MLKSFVDPSCDSDPLHSLTAYKLTLTTPLHWVSWPPGNANRKRPATGGYTLKLYPENT